MYDLGGRNNTPKETIKGYDKYFLVGYEKYITWYKNINFQLKFLTLHNISLIDVLKTSNFVGDYSTGQKGCIGIYVLHKGKYLFESDNCFY